jgi:hypothetical protein
VWSTLEQENKRNGEECGYRGVV